MAAQACSRAAMIRLPCQQGAAQGRERGLDLPPLVIEPDQGGRGVTARIGQGGDEPVVVTDAGLVGAGHHHVGLDDADIQAIEAGQVGAVGQVAQYLWGPGGLGAAQQLCASCVDLGEECVAVEGPVQQDKHAGSQQVQQPLGEVGLIPVGGRADSGAQQAAGAGLGQRHHPQRRITGQAQPVADLADPGPVAVSVGDLEGVQAIERDRAQPGEAHPWGAGLGQRPGDDLEQCPQRCRAKAPAQIP